MAHVSADPAIPRLARLDGLRGLAACGVAFTYHVRGLFPEGAMDTGSPIIDWSHLSGWLFVDLFFLISGYIFAHVYCGSGALRREGGLADFAVARIARLYPLHLVMLLVTAMLFWSKPANTPLAFGAHLLMLQAFVQPVANTFVGPSWSLSVEAICYVLFAVAAAAGPPRLRLVTGFAIALGLFALAIHAAPDGPYARDNVPRGLLGFFLGQVLWHQRARLAKVPGWILVGVMAIGLLIPSTLFGAILPLAVLTFPAALLIGLRLRWLESPVAVWLGDRSYAIYLIHVPLLDLVLRVRGGMLGSSPLELVLGQLGFVAGVLWLSDLALKYVERPARRALREAWERRTLQVANA